MQKQNSLFSTLSHLLSGLFTTMLLGIALKIAMPRLLGPEEIGLYYFAESYANMFLTVLPLGIGTYLVREVPPNPKHANEILWSLLRFEVVFGVVLILSMFISLYVSGASQQKLMLCVAQALFYAVWIFYIDILRNLCLATNKSKQAALTDVAIKIVLVVSGLLSLYYFRSALMLIVCYFLTQLIGVFSLLYILHKNRPAEKLQPTTYLKLFKIFHENSLFFITTVLLAFYTYIDVAMISQMASDREAGLYGTSVKLQGICLFLLPILGGGFQPFFSRVNANDVELGKQVFRRVLCLAIPVFGLITMGLISSVEMVSGILFGVEFAPSHYASIVLAPVLFLTYLNTFISMQIGLLNRGKAMISVTFIGLLVNGALNLYTIPRFFAQIGEGGAGVGASIASIASEAAVTIMFLNICLGLKGFLRVAPQFLFCAAPVFLAAGTYSYWAAIPSFYRIPCAGALYVLFVFVTGSVKVSEIKWLIKTMKGTAEEVSVA